MMIMRSWGPVQTSLLNDAETSLVCWSGKCFANHSRVRGADAQGCLYAMIYFEQILFVFEYKLQNCKSQQGEREICSRMCLVRFILRNDPVIISANWHLFAKNKPYHEKLEGNVLVFYIQFSAVSISLIGLCTVL